MRARMLAQQKALPLGLTRAHTGMYVCTMYVLCIESVEEWTITGSASHMKNGFIARPPSQLYSSQNTACKQVLALISKPPLLVTKPPHYQPKQVQ